MATRRASPSRREWNEGILTRYYLKGGVAMELRFAGAARATKDLDLGLDGNRADRLSSFASTLQLGFDEFTFRLRSQTRQMELADTVRVAVAIAYKTRAWQTVDVDLGPPGIDAPELVEPASKLRRSSMPARSQCLPVAPATSWTFC